MQVRTLANDPQDRQHAELQEDTEAISQLDRTFQAVRAGDTEAFAEWLGLVELPLRSSLGSFASTADVEAVLQEGFLRIWLLAPTLELKGPNASLRYATRMVQNLALCEVRRLGRVVPVQLELLESLTEDLVDAPSPPDPALRDLIARCIERLPRRPREALEARLRNPGLLPDRDLAARMRMTTNTFLQNVVRARRLMSDCLRSHGVPREEMMP